MADLNKSPALWAVYNATQAVESLGCGDAFTAAVVQCSDALQAVHAEVERRMAAEASIATLRAQLAGVRERVEKLPVVLTFEGEKMVYLDDVLAALAKGGA